MKKVCFVLAIILCFCTFAMPTYAGSVFAVEKKSVNILAFGDSISAGYAPNSTPYNAENSSNADDAKKHQMYVAYNNYLSSEYGKSTSEFSYTKLMADLLTKNFGIEVSNVASFANSGDTSTDLVNLLTKDESKKLASGSSVQTNVGTIQNAILSADVITLCIGANDVLTPALEKISNITTLSQTDIDELDAILDKNVQTFKTNFEEIILPKLSQGAQVFVMTIYNPYKAFSKDSVKKMLDSLLGESNAEKIAENLNQLLQVAVSHLEQINEIIRQNATNNILLVDIASKFNALNNEEYSIFVNANFEALSVNDLTSLFGGSYPTYLDPHPTPAGQESIANGFAETYASKNRTIKQIDENKVTTIWLVAMASVVALLTVTTACVLIVKKIKYNKIHF